MMQNATAGHRPTAQPSEQPAGEVTATEVVLPGLVPASGLYLRQRRLPATAAGQVLVEMEASGISFAEQSMRRGRYPGQPKFPFVPGYDMVGTVREVGAGVSRNWIGTRVAAALKTGGWATYLLVPALDLVAVPPTLDPALAEAVIVNGVTAWQMLHRSARVKTGQTVLVHGANGGVGTVLVQLALRAGVQVIGTASPRHHGALRASGVLPLDYNAPDLSAQVTVLAPGGVNAVFDHLGLLSARRSYRLLAPGGRLVLYGTAAVEESRSVLVEFIGLLGQMLLWNAVPGAPSASFYNFWAGHSVSLAAFRRRLRHDLTAVLDLLAQGAIVPQIAARFPLAEIGSALELAESHTALGKVVLVP